MKKSFGYYCGKFVGAAILTSVSVFLACGVVFLFAKLLFWIYQLLWM